MSTTHSATQDTLAVPATAQRAPQGGAAVAGGGGSFLFRTEPLDFSPSPGAVEADAAPGGAWDAGVAQEIVGIWRARAVATVGEMADAALTGSLSPEVVRQSLAQSGGTDGLQVALGEYALAAAAEPQRERYQRLVDLQRAKVALLWEAGGAVTVEDARPLLGGISRQAVERRRERGTLLGLKIGGEYRYPLCQFGDGDVLQGLPDVLRAFTVRSPWTQLSVLISPQDALDGRSVLEALRAGDVGEAVAVAESFGNTGA